MLVGESCRELLLSHCTAGAKGWRDGVSVRGGGA